MTVPPTLGKALLAAGYGFAAGVVAAAALWLMGRVSRLVWAGDESRWRIAAVILAGGALIALLRHVHEGAGRARPGHSRRHKQREVLLIAAMAVIAVGFGGAVGPEAGILALVAELGALAGLLLAHDEQQACMLDEIGAAGALGGLYGSPPGGALVAEAQAPRWALVLAGLTGLLGFLQAASRFMPERPLHIELPPHAPARDGSDMLAALPPALLGALAGLAFALLLPRLQAGLQRLGGVVVQTLAGTAAFALLAAALPALRFSGHHELPQLLGWGEQAGMAALLGLALLKVLALALCLASGWRGGAVFPLLFAGAAAGGSALLLGPGMPATVALVAGMSAALVAGMGKPLAAAAIALLLLIGAAGVGPLCVGVAVGWAASRLAPPAAPH